MIIAAFCAILCRLLAGVVKWQTRRTQNPMLETTCGFKSHRQHQKKRRSLQEGINHRFFIKAPSGAFSFCMAQPTVLLKCEYVLSESVFRHNQRRRIAHDYRKKTPPKVQKPLQDAFFVTKNYVRMRLFVTRLPCKEYLPAARRTVSARRRRRDFALKRKQTSLAISADI